MSAIHYISVGLTGSLLQWEVLSSTEAVGPDAEEAGAERVVICGKIERKMSLKNINERLNKKGKYLFMLNYHVNSRVGVSNWPGETPS
jgi:hypothetical protein